MGSFYSSCSLSHLQITNNDKIVALLLQRQAYNDNSYSHSPCEYYKIASFALTGVYDDYGCIALDDSSENHRSFDLMIKAIANNINHEEQKNLPTKFEQFEDLQTMLVDSPSQSKLAQFSFCFFHEELFNGLIQSDLTGKNKTIDSSWNNWTHIVKTVWHHYKKTNNPDRFVRLLQKPSNFLRLDHDIDFTSEEIDLLKQLRTQEVDYFITSSLNHVLNDDLTTFSMLDYMDLAEKENNGDLHQFKGYTDYQKLAIQMHQFFEGLDFLNIVLLPQVTSGQEIRIIKENDWQMKVLHFTHAKILSLKEDGFLEQIDTDNLKEKQLSTLESHYLENSIDIDVNQTKKGIKL